MDRTEEDRAAWTPPEPAVIAFHWQGVAADQQPTGWDRDWRQDTEDARELALLGVLSAQFDQWGPERTARVLAYLCRRYPDVTIAERS